MEHPIRIWSKAYAPSPDTHAFSVQVDSQIWRQATREEGSRRKFLRIHHPDGLDEWFAPLGDPVPHEEAEDACLNIYMPLWMIDAGSFRGEGEQSTLEIVDEEYFPEATRIVFRVVDSAFYNADIKEELEKALSAIGIVREGMTLQIPIEALGGYAVEVFVSKTEPANLVLCHGEEVAVEFEEPVDQIAPPSANANPAPAPPSANANPVVEPRPPTPQPMIVPLEPQGFRAFQGEGQTLGGSNVNIPEWRRGLPPPPRR